MGYGECRDNGQAMNGVMATLTSTVLTVHMIMNIVNANNNNNNNNNNDNNDNNNNNVYVAQSVAQSEFDNEFGTMQMGMGVGRAFITEFFKIRQMVGGNNNQSGNGNDVMGGNKSITSIYW